MYGTVYGSKYATDTLVALCSRTRSSATYATLTFLNVLYIEGGDGEEGGCDGGISGQPVLTFLHIRKS